MPPQSDDIPPRSVGAPEGNQNARLHEERLDAQVLVYMTRAEREAAKAASRKWGESAPREAGRGLSNWLRWLAKREMEME